MSNLCRTSPAFSACAMTLMLLLVVAGGGGRWARAGSPTPPRLPVNQAGLAWGVIADDSGSSAHASIRGQVTNSRGVLRKVLMVDFDPAQIQQAEVVYEMKIDPYHPVSRRHHNEPSADLVWANLRVVVNGKIAAEGPLVKLATRGWHVVSIDPKLLVRGANTVDLCWAAPSTAGDQGARPAGYYYLGVDTGRHLGRSMSSTDAGSTFTDQALSPGRDGPQGEYMIRLRFGVGLEPASSGNRRAASESKP